MHHADCGSPFADRHGLRLDRSLRRRASDRNRRDCPSHPLGVGKNVPDFTTVKTNLDTENIDVEDILFVEMVF